MTETPEQPEQHEPENTDDGQPHTLEQPREEDEGGEEASDTIPDA